MTGGEIVLDTDDFCIVRTDHLHLAAVRVPDHQPPSWPDGRIPRQQAAGR